MSTRLSPSAPVAVFACLGRLPGMDREAVRRAFRELTFCAEQWGFAAVGTCREGRVSDRPGTWGMLILGFRNEGVRKVVVPSPGHFHRKAAAAASIRAELDETIDGTDPYASEPLIGGTGGHHDR